MEKQGKAGYLESLAPVTLGMMMHVRRVRPTVIFSPLTNMNWPELVPSSMMVADARGGISYSAKYLGECNRANRYLLRCLYGPYLR